jgi:tRNA pseudouridine38-40 synthase
VRTVEEEIEKALYKMNLIAKHNFGDLLKIAWNRATRTDKKVHALQNCFSCKIQYDDKSQDYQQTYEPMRLTLNSLLPADIKVFTLLQVAHRFDSKLNTSHREYSYFLPTFMLTSIKEMDLESPPKQTTEAKDTEGA